MPKIISLVKKPWVKLNGILKYWADLKSDIVKIPILTVYSPGIRIVDPVVLRASRSWWARAASASG